MKMKFTLAFIAVFVFLSSGYSQIQFWSDGFEDAGSPSTGSRAPTSDFSCILAPSTTPTSYFTRTTPGSLNLNGIYSGFQGSKVWAGENVDAGTTCMESSQNYVQSIDWSVNITGKTGLSFRGLFGANNLSGGNWDPITVQPSSYDYLIIEYNIDGGAWTKIIGFYATGTVSSTSLSLDTDGNLIGDGAVLNFALAEFGANIAGTGTTLNLRFSAASNNASNEEFAVDNFRLFETPSCTAPVFSSHPQASRNMCAGAGTTTFGAVAASNTTAFKWQYNSGSGFTDLSNDTHHSGVTSNTLTITSPLPTMNGWQYRAVAINGVASCFTNSTGGTLNVSNIITGPNQTNVDCNGSNTGAASVNPSGGIGSYTYLWAVGGTGPIKASLVAGSYDVTITDGASCQKTQNFIITQPPVLNGSTTVTNVACFGNSTGAINLTPSGGTPGYTFNWNSGAATTEDRTGLAAGTTYSVVITDANNCTRTISGITVTQPAAVVSGTTIVTNVACFGGNTGAINLTPTGGVGPYTYNWNSGVATSEDRTSLTAGSTYSVVITDANGCTGTVGPITVTQPAATVSGTTIVTNVACFGGNTGAINLTPTGGIGPYTFNWGGGVTSEDRSILTAGTYSVTITDANSCTGTVSPTVTQPTAAVSGTTVVTNVACFGNSTGAINLTPTGGTGPYTFNWGGGITSEDRTLLSAGTYSVTITDVNSCTGTVSPTVTQPAAVVSGTTTVTNVACFGNSTGAINLTPTGGVGPYTFNWNSGAATSEDRTGLPAGSSYSVVITDANACSGTVGPITVTQPAAVVSGTTTVTNVSCFGGNNGAINLTPTGGVGPYTYNWNSGAATSEDRTSLTAGSSYSVVITDANGCTGTVGPITVTQPSAAVSGTTVVTNIACFGNSTGVINLTPTGGTGPYTFDWGGGITSEDRSGLTAGTYSVTITDVNGCTGIVSPTVTQPAAVVSGTTVVTNVACFGNSTGAINLTPAGGVGPYTFNWGGGITSEDRTSLAAGTYTVTITDANACTASVSATVTQPASVVSGTTVVTNVSCFGGNNGAINLTSSGGVGPYTFNWVGGATTEDRILLVEGTYTVTITDANGCTGTVSGITVTQPTALAATPVSQTNIACFGGTTGSATVSASDGVPGYTYSWSPSGGTAATASGLTAGTYTVTITDANGCTASQAFTLTEPTAVSFTAASQTNIACFGGNTGAFAVNPATGGTGAFTYDWAPGTPTGDGTTSVTGLTAGAYSVVATDANGCTASISFTITEPPVLETTQASQTNVSCNSGSNGTATVTATGGTPGYSYSWAPSAGNTAAVSGLSAGTYTVTVTDANGCQETETFTITEPAALDASTGSQVDILCNGESTGSATVAPEGGTGAYTYSWSPSGGTGATASGLAAGTYTVTVTDANNCQNTKTFTITQSAPLTSSFSHTACLSYTWGTQTHTTSGTYTQTFEAANGCDSLVTLNLTISTQITNTVTESSCITYTWAQNGETYTVSGLYVDTIPSVGGCDSIVTLDLTINTPSSSSSSEFACGQFTWTQTGLIYANSGVYTDTIQNAAGCDSVITLNLTIGGFSSLQPVNTCGPTYTWPANGVTYTASGMYFDTLVDGNGCDSIRILDLTLFDVPTATATNNGDATITASSGSSYQWINCTTNTLISGATAQTFTATVNGSYAVIVANAENCSDTSNCVAITNVGLDEKNALLGVKLAPNPTQNDVTITFTGEQEASIVIYDAKGKAVMTLDHVQSGEVLSTQAFERGVYLITISTNSGKHTERLVKQ